MVKELETFGAPSRFIPDFLRPLRSLVLAVTDRQGRLIDANQGLYDLFPDSAPQGNGSSPGMLFINPTLEELLARAGGQDDDAPIYTGPMTVGDIDGDPDTWEGRAWWRDSALLVVCERDVQQDRRLRRQLLQLTDEYAGKERELARTNRELTYYADEVERLSLTDPLTGLPNRRSFDQFMRHHADLTERHGDPLTLLLMDLDRFKAINDRLGHQHGDHLLREVAGILAQAMRAADLLARWGGEEFAILAPKTGREDGMTLAERMRLVIEAIPRPEEDLPVTISIGIAERSHGESIENLLHRADAALYHAKDSGRNRVIWAEPDD